MNTQSDSMKEIREFAHGELSMKARLGYVALLLVAAAMTAVIVSLWLTEPALPLRTHLAFGAICTIGVSWMALATWVLSVRRILFARDQVIAGRMAVTFTSVFAASALIAVIATRSSAAIGAFATAFVMLAAAIAVSRRARRRFAALNARRAELELMLGSERN